MLKTLSTNRLTNSPAFQKILLQYNELLKKDGKVNDMQFWKDVVSKELPNYKVGAWYFFLKRFKTENGILPNEIKTFAEVAKGENEVENLTGETKTIVLSNQDATAKGIAAALNMSSTRLSDLMNSPEKMTLKEAADLLFKAMKAQDSRIHAIGKIKEDSREEEKLDRIFNNADYE